MLKAIQLHQWHDYERQISIGVSITGAFIMASSGAMSTPMAIPASIAFYLYENRERITPQFAAKFYDEFLPICASSEFAGINKSQSEILQMMESTLKWSRQS